jgi:hypothetical protein
MCVYDSTYYNKFNERPNCQIAKAFVGRRRGCMRRMAATEKESHMHAASRRRRDRLSSPETE